ncbi:hypothetical protein TNIN_69661 [Trichonephila inaurata madagascariensis]|uniref:Uncharacterized protein n=1 Tax=Trichonephila inaurata madagascariensis TaxID=2747483 RepID=A0A8X7CF93_9ARAC|nr:hypothetical protein TNIN_69661 [Trichonephila inaurata madagascariensis]
MSHHLDNPTPLAYADPNRHSHHRMAMSHNEQGENSKALQFSQTIKKSGFASTAERKFVMEQFTRGANRRLANVEVLSSDSTGSLKNARLYCSSEKQSGHFCRR